MAPTKATPAPKQQRTISSFFTPKSGGTSSQSASSSATPIAGAAGGAGAVKKGVIGGKQTVKKNEKVKGNDAVTKTKAVAKSRKKVVVEEEEEEEEEEEVIDDEEESVDEDDEDEYKEDNDEEDEDAPKPSVGRRSVSTRRKATSPVKQGRKRGPVEDEAVEAGEEEVGSEGGKGRKKLRRNGDGVGAGIGNGASGRGADGEEEDVEMKDGDDDAPEDVRKIISSASALSLQKDTGSGGVGGRKKVKEVAREKTSRYVYKPSQGINKNTADDEEEHDNQPSSEDEALRRKRELLHQKFVQKLGKPTSLDDIARRNRAYDSANVGEDGEEGEEGGEIPEEEEDEAPKGKGKKKGAAAPAGKKGGKSKLTPLEKQVVDIKLKHPDTVLVVEVGYKFRFFGEDARTASKELSIMCIPGKMRFDEHPSEAHLDKFASASIPVHRLHVHVKRLVAAGHKVGIVRQLETAALKAVGDNRNAPFTRKLTNLYTKGTYVDDVDGFDDIAGVGNAAPATGYLLCLTEVPMGGMGADERVNVGIVAVQPSTGDVIYDEFTDGFMRSEIETRLLHIAPCELLVVGDLTKATEKLVTHLAGSTTSVFGDKIRVERVEKTKTMAATAASHVSKFYADKANSNVSSTSADLLDSVTSFPDLVTICLSAMITHLTSYGLEHVFDLTKYFSSFSTRSHMLLNGNTLSSLEVYHNQTDYSEKGSLFWALDRTKTKFGKRLLRKWVGRPLLDKKELEERVQAVEEIKEGKHAALLKLKELFAKTSYDLEKGLIRIYYGKCTRPELLRVLQTINHIATTFPAVDDPFQCGFSSPLINTCISSLPLIADFVADYLSRFNHVAAGKDDKFNFFTNEESEHEAIHDKKMRIIAVEQDLQDQLPNIARILRKKKISFVTVSQIEYLVEVENVKDVIKLVPASWIKISGTKKVSRFHTPEVLKLIAEREQLKEALAAQCDVDFRELLQEISGRYRELRDAVGALAKLDCLNSLAEVARLPGYTKPVYMDGTGIEVVEGRHPMVEQLLTEAYVPNDIFLGDRESRDGEGVGMDESTQPPTSPRAILITGPNMGGKSSYVRSVALISIMAQIGSYVPASAARLGMLDAVFTRMGAQDNMLAGESTFMVELSETSDILKQATSRSLVILDELGRGTSTHDGVAIAHAVLEWVVREVGALTLFVTHYPLLKEVAERWGGRCRCVHMAFEEFRAEGAGRKVVVGSGDGDGVAEAEGPGVDLDGHGYGDDDDDDPAGSEITFLYKVADGVAHRSYGLNVARLAGVPKKCLRVAAVKSRELERELREREAERLAEVVRRVLSVDGGEGGMDVDGGKGAEVDRRSDPRYLLERVGGLEDPL